MDRILFVIGAALFVACTAPPTAKAQVGTVTGTLHWNGVYPNANCPNTPADWPVTGNALGGGEVAVRADSGSTDPEPCTVAVKADVFEAPPASGSSYWTMSGYPVAWFFNYSAISNNTDEFWTNEAPNSPGITGAWSDPTYYYINYPYDLTQAPVTLTWNLVLAPPLNPSDNGVCKQCQQAGAPINVTNGNAWIQQRDYSLPGLGGGLELVRTWNGHWQDVSPPTLTGMFGHSWRSNYEETITVIDSNTLRYWRGDGSGWTFSYDIPTGNYLQTSPLDEHASIQISPIDGHYTLRTADGNEKTFNSSLGQLTAIIDRNGNQTKLTYDSSNRLTRVTDAAGRSVTFSYRDSVNTSQATTAQDSAGIFATYVYDSTHRLIRVTYADSSALNFAYDSNSMITSVTDTNGKLLEAHTYDSAHNALTSTRANSADQVSLTYSSVGTTQLSDSVGNVTTYAYQTIGGHNFTNAVSGPGCSSCGVRNNQATTYDAQGDVLGSTDALGNVTSFTYDANGNVLTKSVKLNSTTTFTWTYTYNQFQEVLTARDPLGNTTTNSYDAKGNLLTTTTPPPASGVSGSLTTFAYDSKGELTTVTDPRGNATNIGYTLAGLIASVADAQGNATIFTYDARGNRTASTDALGNVTRFAYDSMNRLTRITPPGPDPRQIGAGNTVTSFTYDSRGRRTSVTDANNETTSYAYDDADRLVSVTDAAGNVTAYGYDTENHLEAITDAASQVTNFAYDPLGRVTQVTFPSTRSESYNYDAVGNLLAKTDRKGQKITYNYDNLYRLVSKTYPDSTGVSYSYDALARLTQAVDPTGTYRFAYDNLGRLTGTTTHYAFLTGRTLTESYSYDAASNRTSFTDPEGGLTNYTYDTLNRLTGLTDFNSNPFAFGYDALGRRTSLTRPNAVTTSYQYDALSRVLSVLHQNGSSVLDGGSYNYDAVGNRTAKTNLLQKLPAGDLPTSNFAYDAIYQLTQATQAATTTENYSYDAVGNRLSSLGAPYAYNVSNELTAAGKATFAYDANGNTVSKADSSGSTTYTWDFENRLTSVTLPNGHVQNYKYDPFGRRVFKDSPTNTRIFVYDGDNITERLDASGKATVRFTQGLGIDDPLAMYQSGVGDYYEADGLGSITSLTNASGNIANTYEYDSFGKLTGSNGTVSNAFRYTGREDDGETKLYYYRARYYYATTGRFLSEDPLQFEVSQNFYSYVGNTPVDFNDPLGLAKCDKRPCDERVKDILNLAAEVSRRFMEYNNPTWLLPFTGPNSRAGHRQQLQEKQDKLADEIDDYNKSGCPTPIPVPVEDLATRPLPPLTPSPIHLPPPPNVSPSTVVATGAGLTLILVIVGVLAL